tara:strand:- start:21 stop:401 length:381 start_codon:yes stop_codon:yes gene_type:complete
MQVHVLLYDPGKDSEGIHSLELNDATVVLMFENKDDAERYCGLLEAQDFPKPTVEALELEEIEQFCQEAGYESKLVKNGFVPTSDEERLLLAPPPSNRDVARWNENNTNSEQIDIDDFRRKLEELF